MKLFESIVRPTAVFCTMAFIITAALAFMFRPRPRRAKPRRSSSWPIGYWLREVAEESDAESSDWECVEAAQRAESEPPSARTQQGSNVPPTESPPPRTQQGSSVPPTEPPPARTQQGSNVPPAASSILTELPQATWKRTAAEENFFVRAVEFENQRSMPVNYRSESLVPSLRIAAKARGVPGHVSKFRRRELLIALWYLDHTQQY